MAKTINNRREKNLANISLAATLILLAAMFYTFIANAWQGYLNGETRFVFESVLFITAMIFVAYGNVLYQVCLAGYYKRREEHQAVPREELEAIYTRSQAPGLTVLIPAYKEERSVNWQTMMSAALAEYPSKNVVLLIDDPYRPNALADIVKLEDTRLIPGEMQQQFDVPAAFYRAEREAFEARAKEGLLHEAELIRLADHYDGVAAWLEKVSIEFAAGREGDDLPFADRFFIDSILMAPARQHQTLASGMRVMAANGTAPSEEYFARQYARLAALFSVNFSSFERKKYDNLCHEANKAMNLNCYMNLVGKSWKEVEVGSELHLVETTADKADFTIAHADYINTIDSDSVMLSEYALRLIHIMEQPENRRLAVIQSPCSSFPGCPGGLERTAGACIDVQFLTHQGYTHWGASFWVGANAMLRREALEEIKETRIEDGKTKTIYIQDRTVIEDTESTIDLVHKGWKLYNYTERMTFSATPPDFGSLLIQRRRWSNGGLIILPKLFRYAMNSRKTLGLAKEMFMRFHYLASTTTGCVAAWIFILYPFSDLFFTPLLPLSVVPFFLLYARDLKNAGYSYAEVPRICAMTVMLFPIVTGGVLKMFQQIITGQKIPFGRTPKITGRTAAPALYCLIEVVLTLTFIGIAARDLYLERWTQAIFASVNAGFLTYALVRFIGVRNAAEDMLAGVKARWRESFYNAEIIPIITGKNVAMPTAKQA